MSEREPRIETGSVVFGSDWPGLFLRGDDAFYFGVHLGPILDAAEKTVGAEHYVFLQTLRGLVQLLLSVDVREPLVHRQQLRSARECLAGTPTEPGPIV